MCNASAQLNYHQDKMTGMDKPFQQQSCCMAQYLYRVDFMLSYTPEMTPLRALVVRAKSLLMLPQTTAQRLKIDGSATE